MNGTDAVVECPAPVEKSAAYRRAGAALDVSSSSSVLGGRKRKLANSSVTSQEMLRNSVIFFRYESINRNGLCKIPNTSRILSDSLPDLKSRVAADGATVLEWLTKDVCCWTTLFSYSVFMSSHCTTPL